MKAQNHGEVEALFKTHRPYRPFLQLHLIESLSHGKKWPVLKAKIQHKATLTLLHEAIRQS